MGDRKSAMSEAETERDSQRLVARPSSLGSAASSLLPRPACVAPRPSPLVHPSAPLGAQPDPLSPAQTVQWTFALLVLGVVARAVRYLLRFPLWPDEAFLAANLLDRGYLELMEPLDYAQVCPVLFLWLQWTVVKALGFSEYTLRLIPFLCGVGSLLLFRHVAGRLLKGSALVLAVGVFAVAYPLVRYSSEAKPYGVDVLVSLVLLSLLVAWMRRPERTRWLWALAGVAPVAVGLSYPAVFVAGGIGLTVAWALWTTRSRAGWVPWAAYNLALLAGFVALMALSAGKQDAATGQYMRQYWSETFPPLHAPAKLAVWLAVQHTSQLLEYPVGGPRGASALTFLCCLIGLVVLIRRRQHGVWLACVTPLGLNFVAAALHRYPYGGHVRFALYLAPMVCLLAGLGLAVLVARRARRAHRPETPVALAAALLAVLALGCVARDLVKPYKTPDYLRFRDFARWFWNSKSADGELLCLETDLERGLVPELPQDDIAALYLCNQRIYSPRHARGETPRLDRVAPDWPLRCVRLQAPRAGAERWFDEWLGAMRRRFLLVGRERHRFPMYDPRGEVAYVHFVEVYQFIPRPPDKNGSTLQADAALTLRR